MKKIITILFTTLSVLLHAQYSTIITPTPLTSQFAYVYTFQPTQGFPTSLHFNAGYNTIGGTPEQSRSYIRFDLSQIPAGSTIISAYLDLYHDGSIGSHQSSGSNGTKLSMVNQSWAANTISWNVQPTINTTNEVIVGPTANAASDILNIDVTAPVQYWVNNPSQNYGWRFWQINEGSVLHSVEDFASSFDTAHPSKMPNLVITYQLNTTCSDSLVIQQDTSNTQFSYMYDYSPNASFNNGTHFDAGYNSIGGTPTQSRCYARYDLSQIPAGATVTSANFSLYYDPNVGAHNMSGSNATRLSVVTQPWDQSTVVWNTQPTVDSINNQVIVGSTATNTSNITNIDVTAPVQYWVSNPTMNYGWRFWQVNEHSVAHSLQDFASRNDATASLRPKLVVYYNYTCAASGIATTAGDAAISVYPNPSSNVLYIKNATEDFTVNVFDLLGQKVLDETNNKEINTSLLAPGTYLLHYTDLTTQKLTVIKFIKL